MKMQDNAPEKLDTRCGFVALIGAPNAGKSTLINQLVGGKVAIVSPKVQTTRTRVTGIAMRGPAQIVFVDTPGIFNPSKRLDRSMVHAAWEGVKDADVVALLIDVSKKNPLAGAQDILEKLKEHDKPIILILNKIDLVPKDSLLALTAQFNQAFAFERTFMISALKNKGVDDLLDYLAAALPEDVWHYPDDELTTMPMRLLAAEITREKLFLKLYQELPYACTVETEIFDDKDPAKWLVEQTIYVQRDGQKAIILGKGGQQLKEIGMLARKDMQEQFGVPIHLQLFVKVRENWLDDPERYRPWGLEYKV